VILAIDPGDVQSAYALLDADLRPVEFAISGNDKVLSVVNRLSPGNEVAIEMVASYGMAVGKTVFETVFWIGRFWERALASGASIENLHKIYRKDVKMNLCHSMKAKDANIRQALIDRFGEVGTKKSPGWFYGAKKDIWSAIAVGITLADKLPFDEYHEPTRNELDDIFRPDK